MNKENKVVLTCLLTDEEVANFLTDYSIKLEGNDIIDMTFYKLGEPSGVKELLNELKFNQKVNKKQGLENRVNIDYIIERLEDILYEK